MTDYLWVVSEHGYEHSSPVVICRTEEDAQTAEAMYDALDDGWDYGYEKVQVADPRTGGAYSAFYIQDSWYDSWTKEQAADMGARDGVKVFGTVWGPMLKVEWTRSEKHTKLEVVGTDAAGVRATFDRERNAAFTDGLSWEETVRAHQEGQR